MRFGRKYWMALITLAAALYLEIQNGGITDNFFYLACGINGIYGTANVAKQHQAFNKGSDNVAV